MKFTKMQGTGNDFLMVETGDDKRDWESISEAMCDRHFGVGADGVMLVMPSEKADVRMRLFNNDGSEAEVSGNGVRCLVKYAVDRGIARPQDGRVSIEVAHDVLEADVTMDGGSVSAVRLSMGRPYFEPEEIPVAAQMEAPVLDFPIQVNGQRLVVNCVSMGNPHAVLFVPEPVEEYPLERLGPLVEHHTAFPARVNFGVAHVEARDRMHVRVWERGCGETLACGTGSCAAVVMARLHDLAGEQVEIVQPGGELVVEWDGRGDVYLSGPAEMVFEGEWPG
jgi:diaminopimelate epimerase